MHDSFWYTSHLRHLRPQLTRRCVGRHSECVRLNIAWRQVGRDVKREQVVGDLRQLRAATQQQGASTAIIRIKKKKDHGG